MWKDVFIMSDIEVKSAELTDDELDNVIGGMRPIADGKTMLDILFGSYSDGKEHESERIGGIDHGK